MPTSKLPTRKLETRVQLLQATYRDAARDIDSALRSAALTDFQKFRYGELKKQVDGVLRGLDKEALSATQDLIPQTYRHGADLAAQAMREQGVDVRALNMGNRIHTAAAGAVADQMATDLLEANGVMRRQAHRILRKTQQRAVEDAQLNRLIAQGVVKGETRRETSKNLTKALRERVGFGEGVRIRIPCKDGVVRAYKPGKYAELVARTQTREAVTEGTLRAGEEYGMQLFRFSVHEGACSKCQPYQGKVYAVGNHPDFPPLEVKPPIHPNCAHVLTPVSESVLKRRGEYEGLKKLSNDPDAIY